MSKITIIEPNTNDKDQTRNYLVKGEKGYSAYELYVRNGGTMTEKEWLDAFLSAENYYSKSETDTLLGAKVNTSDIKDNLTSTDTNKPLSSKQGKVLKGLIDDNTTAIGTKANSSDVYSKTDSDNKYVVKGDFAVTTGVLAPYYTVDEFNYPEGFTYDNCVVISFQISFVNDGNYITYIAPQYGDPAINEYSLIEGNVWFGSTTIQVSISTVTEEYDKYYKLVLMKIS